MFFPPFRSQFTGEGFMENSGFVGFKAIHHSLCLFLGLIQLGKQAFNAVNNALLLSKRRERKLVEFYNFLGYIGLSSALTFFYKIIFLRLSIIKKIFIVR